MEIESFLRESDLSGDISCIMTAVTLSFSMDSQGSPPIDWGKAIETNRRWLGTVIRSRLADHAAAEDVLQEVALAAIAQTSRPVDPDKIAPWLYRIALRKVINHHRSMGRRRRLIENAIGAGKAKEESREVGPGEWLMQSESRTSVATAMRSLPDHDRQILMLKYTEGWGYHELAQHLGISVKTVEYRLLKARRLLRQRLAESDY